MLMKNNFLLKFARKKAQMIDEALLRYNYIDFRHWERIVSPGKETYTYKSVPHFSISSDITGHLMKIKLKYLYNHNKVGQK